jgi:hypothetical protein
MPVKKGIAVKTLAEKSKIKAWQDGVLSTAPATDHTPEKDRNMAPTNLTHPVIAANSALDSGPCVQSLKGAHTMNEHATTNSGQRFQVVFIMGTETYILRDRSITDGHGGYGEMELPLYQTVTEENFKDIFSEIVKALQLSGKAGTGDEVLCTTYPKGSRIERAGGAA